MALNSKKYKVLIVGAGHMGISHAKAYHKFSNCEIVGIVSRGDSNHRLNQILNANYPLFHDYYLAFKVTQPDIVMIATYVETHYEYTKHALTNDAHVFVEKPLTDTVDKANELIDISFKNKKKMIVGFILRYHPGWKKFIEIAKTLGSPLVMRMNLNQQSFGENWEVHKKLIRDTSPVVDCGVHYIDVMNQIVAVKPIRVSGIGARLSDEIGVDKINYGQLQLTYEDGSVAWYEAGWGPMVSETAHFIKDVFGPKGSVSIVPNDFADGTSSDVNSHVANQTLKIHHAQLENGKFVKVDEYISLVDEPDHDELCELEQIELIKAIEEDLDLTSELKSGVEAMTIVEASHQSFKSGKTIHL